MSIIMTSSSDCVMVGGASKNVAATGACRARMGGATGGTSAKSRMTEGPADQFFFDACDELAPSAILF